MHPTIVAIFVFCIVTLAAPNPGIPATAVATSLHGQEGNSQPQNNAEHNSYAQPGGPIHAHDDTPLPPLSDMAHDGSPATFVRPTGDRSLPSTLITRDERNSLRTRDHKGDDTPPPVPGGPESDPPRTTTGRREEGSPPSWSQENKPPQMSHSSTPKEYPPPPGGPESDPPENGHRKA